MLSRDFLEIAGKIINVPSAENDFAQVKEILLRAVREILDPRINPQNIEIYMHGSYANNTNIFFPSNLEIIVELPAPIPQNRFRLYNDYYVELQFDWTPAEFTEILFRKLEKMFEGKISRQRQIIVAESLPNVKHKIEITPAFTFRFESNRGEFKGALVYDKSVNSHLVTFPKVHQRNAKMFDDLTGGNFFKIVRAFKTLNKMMAREVKTKQVRGYFIQCMLFNVPRNLYVGDDLRIVFYSVLNYLKRASLEDWTCQNMVWSLFGIAPEFWEIEEAEQFIKDILKFEKDISLNRINIA